MSEAAKTTQAVPVESSPSSLPQRPTLRKLCVELRKVDWEDMVLHLYRDNEELCTKIQDIKDDFPRAADRRREAYNTWLKETPDASWDDVVAALHEIGEATLANKLEKNYQWKEPRAQSMVTYIQTADEDQPIKVTPADKEFCKIHLKDPLNKSCAYYKIIPEATSSMKSTYNKPVPLPWIQMDIKQNLIKFLGDIEKSEQKDEFRVGYEARFGQYYVVLQEGSENLPACKISTFKPDLRNLELNYREFHPEIRHETEPVFQKFCKVDQRRRSTVIDPFKFVIEGQEAGLYIAVIKEAEHGTFVLNAVYRQPMDQRNSARFDIVLPGREYDIRIGDNCGPLIPQTRDSLSYRLAEDITRGMKRKKQDRSQLSLTPRGRTSKGESTYYVKYFRQKVQYQYPWIDDKKWVLAKYDLDIMYENAIEKFPESGEHDIDFDPRHHKVELELWNEKIYPKDVDKARPSRDEYLHMQSCKTSLFLPGEEASVPHQEWTTEKLTADFDEFLQAAFDVADALEESPKLRK